MNTITKIKPETGTPIPPPEPEPGIHARMVAIMRDLGAIGKDKKNEAQGFKYRGIDDVYNAINPILAKHGVYMAAQIVEKSREERTNHKGTVLAFTCLRMRYRFTAEDGSHVETEAEGEGMDSGDKSSNKAMAVAHKYALLQTFCIPTQDLDDPDAHVHEVSAKPSPAQASHTDNPDVTDGVKNWCDQAKAKIDGFKTLPDLHVWLEENEAALDRLKKKALPSWSDLMRHSKSREDEIIAENKVRK